MRFHKPHTHTFQLIQIACIRSACPLSDVWKFATKPINYCTLKQLFANEKLQLQKHINNIRIRWGCQCNRLCLFMVNSVSIRFGSFERWIEPHENDKLILFGYKFALHNLLLLQYAIICWTKRLKTPINKKFACAVAATYFP